MWQVSFTEFQSLHRVRCVVKKGFTSDRMTLQLGLRHVDYWRTSPAEGETGVSPVRERGGRGRWGGGKGSLREASH